MKVMLTSSLGGSTKVNGIRVPAVLIQHNGLLDSLKSIWTQNANVLIVCADPSDYDKNDCGTITALSLLGVQAL